MGLKSAFSANRLVGQVIKFLTTYKSDYIKSVPQYKRRNKNKIKEGTMGRNVERLFNYSAISQRIGLP